MNSVWTDKTELPKFSMLEHDAKTEVLIIGGGLAGILCAYMLSKYGIDYMLVEADSICSGATKNTTAKITSQHGLVYHKLIREFGIEKVRMYLEANQDALKQYEKICSEIDCDFEKKDAYVYSLNHFEKIQKELDALRKLGFPAEYADNLPLPFSTVGAVKFPDQAQFNPLKFVTSIAAKLNIYEKTFVKELIFNSPSEYKAAAGNYEITAKSIIVTTHFPFINKHGSYFIKMYQQRSYVIAVENAVDVQGMYIDEAENGISLRNYEKLLLIGGGGHRTGKQGGGYSELEHFAKIHYPAAKEKYRFAAQDCMTLDRVPYIGFYSKNTPNFYVATGFNKWGMTSSMLAAMLLSDMIQGKKNPYADVFSPSRTILRPQLAVNAIESIAGLLAISSKRCPHLGCALKWNSQEHTWDCPCHGSRFTKAGKLIDNPATGNLKCYDNE